MASLTTTDPAATLRVSPTSAATLLKTDTHGRVRATPERRAAILAKFARSGVSAAQFAQLAGINFSTFAHWGPKPRRPKAGASARKPRTPVAQGRRWVPNSGAGQPRQVLREKIFCALVRDDGGHRLERA